MKELFITEPILAQFDWEKHTVLEADSSGYASGGVLSQFQPDGSLRPCAFFSKKNSPAESNYVIHDKELLAIIRCLKEWDTELRSLQSPFVIYTDHQNLQYFTKVQRLNERQVRWADFLSKFNYQLRYRPGSKQGKSDALSRRDQDQDQPDSETGEKRLYQLFQPHVLPKPGSPIFVSVTQLQEDFQQPQSIFPAPADEPLNQQWEEAMVSDPVYAEALSAVQAGNRRFKPSLGLKISISECDIDNFQRLRYRERLWVPSSELLRTGIIQRTHDSSLSGHPGANITYSLVARRFYWPNISQDVRRFVRNCNVCGRTAYWREKKHGLLKPLPIPLKMWSEISMDFISKLPPTLKDEVSALVITDRLSKGVIFTPMVKTTAEDVAAAFIQHFLPVHGLPEAIVSDRGTQFVGHIWKRICATLHITRRLSTAYHPETDGSTERMNQNLEAYLSAFCAYSQRDWADLLPVAALAINSRPSSVTGLSPFFMLHGYDFDPLQLQSPLEKSTAAPHRSPLAKADYITDRLRTAHQWAQAAISVAQETQEVNANRSRQPAVKFNPGDKVWLSLKNITSERPSKKLDWRNAKFTVIKAVGSHAYQLNTPEGIHNVFHTNLLRLAQSNPFPSQFNDDPQPPPIRVDNEDEQSVEEIRGTRLRKIGRGRRRQLLVKWVGFARPTWEPFSALENTVALDVFEDKYGKVEDLEDFVVG